MFRLETRFIIIVSLIITWTMPTYMVLKYSIENKALQESYADLRKQMEVLKNKIDSSAVVVNEKDISSYKPLNNFKRDTQPAASVESHQDDRAPSLVAEPERGDINIFVETKTNLGKEFYKQTLATITTTGNRDLFNHVIILPESERKRILVTGGAGFVGSHLVDSLMLDGHEVIVCDNFLTGRKSNIEHWQGHPNFELINHDVINPLTIEVNEIYHLASPASPLHYMSNPIKTIKTNTLGTINMLGLAKRVGARILIASTSEIYGDPEVHPQSETYWGNTNPIGPRSCYDESKRLSESLAVAYNLRENVSIGIARIFNTYGPRMHPNDGRVVSNFVIQAIGNEPITVYGSGKQTRSFQYITDLVDGLKKLMASNVTSPINLGNPNEMTIHSLALQIKGIMPNSSSDIVFNRLPIDDPHRRKPEIRKAISLLNWEPIIPLMSGLKRTIDYFNQEFILIGHRQMVNDKLGQIY